MRNLEEIKAEVFLRSENRIKQRKRNRNRILACCIPLCLCIAILAVIYMPDFHFNNDKNSHIVYEEENAIEEDFDGASHFAYTSVEIKNTTAPSGISNKETDVTRVEKIYNIIQSSFNIEYNGAQNYGGVAGGGSASKGDNYNNSSLSDVQDTNKIISYSFKFSTDDVTQSIYTLDGNILTNEATKHSVVLTDSQMLELETAIGMELR